jgi:hypothetical protein
MIILLKGVSYGTSMMAVNDISDSEVFCISTHRDTSKNTLQYCIGLEGRKLMFWVQEDSSNSNVAKRFTLIHVHSLAMDSVS